MNKEANRTPHPLRSSTEELPLRPVFQPWDAEIDALAFNIVNGSVPPTWMGCEKHRPAKPGTLCHGCSAQKCINCDIMLRHYRRSGEAWGVEFPHVNDSK